MGGSIREFCFSFHLVSFDNSSCLIGCMHSPHSNRLVGKWGLTDVSDCVHSVSQLSTPSPSLSTPIDPTRTVITGGSAGGFTVLAALCAFPTTYAAGTSSYGVSDLRKLAEDTHKFESRYLEKLVGGTVEEVPEVYKERSPISNADKIDSPLLVRSLFFYCIVDLMMRPFL